MKIAEFLRGRFFFKIIALILAVGSYIYVRGEIGNRNIGIRGKEYLKDITSKVVPVKVELKGEPPQGYQVLKADIKITPQKIILIGKKGNLDRISQVSTQEIDVRKFTHTQLVYAPLLVPRDAVNISPNMIKVEIPILSRR